MSQTTKIDDSGGLETHSVPQISVATKSIPQASEAKTCSVAGCEKKHHAKGLCSAHYHRFERYGDPLITNMTTSEQQKRIESLVVEIGVLKEVNRKAYQEGYRKGSGVAIVEAPKQIITEYHLKQEYNKGYKDGVAKAPEANSNVSEAYYQRGLAEGRNQGTINGDTWFKRSQSYEAEVERLKALIGKAVGMIVEEAL